MGPNCSSFLLAVFSALIVLVTADGTSATNGQNPISYPLGGNLNAGSPITITWKPTTSGTITLHVLKGPTDNLLDLGPIAANIANSGSYSWSVPSTFEDSAAMPAGNKYGIKIIDDLTGTFEYSPPFDMTVPAAATTSSTPTETAASASASADVTSATAGPTGVATYGGPAQEDNSAADTTGSSTPSSSSAAASSSIFGDSKASDLTAIPDLGLIFGAASAGVGGLIVIIVVAVVWARIRSDRKKANYYIKSFRDRRSAFDSETPTTRRHSRSSSSSSFGDRRASQLFNYPRLHRLLSSRTLTRGTSSRSVKRGLSHRGASNGRSSPPPPMPPLTSIQLRNPPPPPTRGPLQVVNNGVLDSPPPPLTPLPIAITRAAPAPLDFSGGASFQPYKPRAYTPVRPGFEDVNL